MMEQSASWQSASARCASLSVGKMLELVCRKGRVDSFEMLRLGCGGDLGKYQGDE